MSSPMIWISFNAGHSDSRMYPREVSDWPINSVQAHEALANITSTHRVTHTTLLGNLSSPESMTLMDTVVRASITLRHWNIGSKEGVAGCDSYAEGIDSIRVIVAAPPLLAPSSLPHKYKIMPTDPGSTLSQSGSMSAQ
ncbi:hypothetical protein C8J57DRAFT_1212972 [Mycena rebaudengoi]|nr:hypothetical protein C8J57DRAFT_1212972 [Mycena rebaudengoi]